MNLIHDRETNRFRMKIEDRAEAFLEYSEPEPGTIDLLHTVVPVKFREQGIGTQLVEQVLQYARDNQLRIVPTCPFVARHLEEHPEYRGMVADE